MDDRYDNFRVPPRSYGTDIRRGTPPHPAPAPAQHRSPVHHTAVAQPVPAPVAPRPQPVSVPQHPEAHPRPPVPAAPAHHQSHQSGAVAAAPAKPTKKRGRAKKFFKTIGIIVLVGILAAGAFAAYKYGYKPYLDRKDSAAAAAPMVESTSPDPAVQLSSTLGKTIDLPSETPILVTVQDASKVSANPFFVKAQSGDQVLYYQNAKIAVLYRPSTKKVINYSPNAVISNLQDASQPSQ